MTSENREEQTYYEILEVSPNAQPQEIFAAYQKAKTTYSPESPALYSMFSQEEARELLNLIEEAFRILSNKSSRMQYDKKIGITKSKENEVYTPSLSEVLPDVDPDEELNEKADTADFMAELSMPKSKQQAPPEKEMPSKQARKKSEGQSKTRLSTYELDPSFQEELDQTENFDGTLLQKVRLYKNVKVNQLCEEIRISKTYLNAIEANDFKKLPAPVFVRGFLIQMARVLGLDEEKVASSYLKLLKDAQK